MRVSFYGHVRQYLSLREEIDRGIHDVLMRGEYVLGPELVAFEEELAAYCGARHAVGVNSGTDALWLALLALGIGPGDECITTANTFFGTAEAIWIAGATAVFVDTDAETHCIDAGCVADAITDRTRAIIPVHLYGQCANMRAIRDVASRADVKIVEDCAQAIGARGDGFAVGDLSDAVGLSFIANKNLGTYGDAGAVLTNDPDTAAALRRLRNHGSAQRGVHAMGFNSRLDDLHAAVLRAKLRHLDDATSRRRQWASRYTRGLEGVGGITLPCVAPGNQHVFHLYVIHVDDAAQRDALLRFLERHGVEAKTHYAIPIHLQHGFPWHRGARIVGSLRHTEQNAARCVSLPLYPELTASEVDYVVDAVSTWSREAVGTD